MPKIEIPLTDEFAATMQQLVAEAEEASPRIDGGGPSVQSEERHGGFAAINDRITGLERAMSASLEKLGAALPSNDSNLAQQLQRVDENLVALRNTESVNQRLFNSLHEELKEYRDNFLRDSLQKPFIRDLVVLFDDLSSLSAHMQSARDATEGKQGALGQWCANLENALHSVLEIMHRMEVTEIEPKHTVDRAFHRVVSYEPADFAEEDGQVVMRVKRGFLWRDQILRPEEVVAKRFS